MTINFFKPAEIFRTFCKHFSLDEDCFLSLLNTIDPVHDSAFSIVQGMNIDLLTSIDDCEIVCRHITTCADGLASIRSSGLLTLDKMLSSDTALSRFLKHYEIVISPLEHKLSLKNREYRIVGWNERCPSCPFGRTSEEICRFGSCDYGQKMTLLHTKLYHDKSEVEAYVSGSDESMLEDYTSILDGPEILYTIGGIINAIYPRNDPCYLQNAWSKQRGMKRYILEFPVPLNAIDIDLRRKEKYCDSIEWYKHAGFSNEDYKQQHVPSEFYKNKMIIEVFFNAWFSNHIRKNDYCQVLPTYFISPDSIIEHKAIDM